MENKMKFVPLHQNAGKQPLEHSNTLRAAIYNYNYHNTPDAVHLTIRIGINICKEIDLRIGERVYFLYEESNKKILLLKKSKKSREGIKLSKSRNPTLPTLSTQIKGWKDMISPMKEVRWEKYEDGILIYL